jgi:sortase A
MRLLKASEYVLALMGLSALGYSTCTYLLARTYQLMKGREFSRTLRAAAAPSTETRPFSQPDLRKREEGAVIGNLTIPRLGLSSIVIEGDSDPDLELAPGHVPETSLPGEGGNVAIAGHRDTFFRPLRLIGKNDTITIATLGGEYAYRVVSTEIVKPDRVQVLGPTKTETLTLITCYPFYFVGPAPQRFIVRAERIEPDATSRPTVEGIPDASRSSWHASDRSRQVSP